MKRPELIFAANIFTGDDAFDTIHAQRRALVNLLLINAWGRLLHTGRTTKAFSITKSAVYLARPVTFSRSIDPLNVFADDRVIRIG